MWTDDLTPAEARAALALRATLHDPAVAPARVDPAWFASAPVVPLRGRAAWRRGVVGAGLAAALVLVVALAALPRFAGQPGTSAGVSSGPGHFDNGTFSFAYPESWATISGAFDDAPEVHTLVVIGTGSWKSGCTYGPNGGACTGDQVDVTGGRVVVKLSERAGGPAPLCGSPIPATATFGENAVRGDETANSGSWEIRRPNADFGWPNNVLVQAWADTAAGMAQVEALIESFRWADGISGGDYCSGRETQPTLIPFSPSGDLGVRFLYPSNWSILHGYDHFGIHGPTVFFAVGIGSFDAGCTDGAGTLDCAAAPTYTVPADGVVVFMYEEAGLGAQPTAERTPPVIQSGEVGVIVMGRTATYTHGDGWARWQISPTWYVEAHWGANNAAAEAQVQALVESLQMANAPTKS